MRITPLSSLLALLACSAAVAADRAATPPEPIVTPLTTQPLSDYPGKEVLVLSVEYPPGATEHAHRHDAHAFVYVLEGSIVMGVAGSAPVTLKAGETFHEGPKDVHTIGRNASQDKPARFVVFLLKDKGKPAVLPAD